MDPTLLKPFAFLEITLRIHCWKSKKKRTKLKFCKPSRNFYLKLIPHFFENFDLPPHQRCAAHTLNLVASTDLKPENFPNKCKLQMRSAMAKCSALWNRVHRSSLAAEKFEKHASRALVVPNDTRWSSLFNTLDCLIKLENAALDVVFDDLKLPSFTSGDRLFLSEYHQVLGPIAHALNILQGEEHTFLGIDFIRIIIITGNMIR